MSRTPGFRLLNGLLLAALVVAMSSALLAADDEYVPGRALAEKLDRLQRAKEPGQAGADGGKVLRMGTAVDDEETVEIRGVPPLQLNRPDSATSRPPVAAPAAPAVAAAPLPVPTDYDQFFAAPLGKPNDPNKYKYIGPIVGGHDPSKVDWSAFGAKSAEEKRRFMVDYAQGRLKVGAEFGGIDATSDSPAPAPTPTETAGGGSSSGGEAGGPDGKGPPTIDENGEKAWCNTIQEPNIAPKSKYRNALMAGIDKVIETGTGLKGPGSTEIADYDAFHAAVVAEMRGQGYCALHDGEELAICRPGDTFNEQFDISTASGFVRRFYAAYIIPPVPGLRAQGAGQ